MNILVTGGSGFIGREIVKQLLALGHHVSDCGRYKDFDSPTIHYIFDITNAKDCKRALDSVNPDIIFHLAGNPLVKLDESNPTEVTKVNVVGTQNLLHYAPAGCKFVLASSATVYGTSYSTSREYDKLSPESVYAATKVSAEALVEAYGKLRRIKPLILRYVANVGPQATHGVVKAFVEKLKGDSSHLEILGVAPGTIKPYMHVEDTASASIFLALQYTKNIIFNINYYQSPISVEQVANTVMHASGIRKPLRWLGEASLWPGDNAYVDIETSLLESTGWKPKYKNSIDAIEATVKGIVS